MNGFQQRCRARLEQVLARHGVETSFDRLPGDPDRTGNVEDRSGHLFAQFAGGAGMLSVFLYRDEAAIRTERNWYVFERQHHGGEPDLIEALSASLDELLRT
jgi:hypothetical protein